MDNCSDDIRAVEKGKDSISFFGSQTALLLAHRVYSQLKLTPIKPALYRPNICGEPMGCQASW